jgi:capsule polysaccharide export protein KpsE/RkpR
VTRGEPLLAGARAKHDDPRKATDLLKKAQTCLANAREINKTDSPEISALSTRIAQSEGDLQREVHR